MEMSECIVFLVSMTCLVLVSTFTSDTGLIYIFILFCLFLIASVLCVQ